MKLRPWQSVCSSTTGDETPTPPPHKLLLLPDTGSNISDTTTTTTGSYSLHSNLSSIHSVQKSFAGTLNLSFSNLRLTSLKPLPAADVTCLAVDNHLLYAAAGNLINVIDSKSLTLLDTFSATRPSSGSVKSVTFNNGNIFTAHQDNKIRVWRRTENKRHKRIATLPTLEDRLLRSLLPKNYVNVRRHRKKLWVEHHDAVSGLAVISDHLICSVSWDKYLKIWRTSDFRCVESIKAHDDAINAVAVAADGTIYTGSGDRRIKVWGKPFTKYRLIATLDNHKSAVNALALNDVGSVLFSGACDRAILVWGKDHSSDRMVLTGALRGHNKATLCLISVSDLLFSGSADRTVRIWRRGDEGKFCCLKVLDGYEKPIRSLVVDPARDPLGSGSKSIIKVFSGSVDKEIKITEISFKG